MLVVLPRVTFAGDALAIDPLLLAEATAVWEIAAAKDNPLWPGWDASKTPILIYIPGVEDVLINHPKPPPGFEPYIGSHTFPGGKIFVKKGATILDWDGQNTSKAVGGVETLVVADTTSNRRMMLRGLLDDPRATETKLADLSLSELATDPYKQISTIAHEAFHVFQNKSAPDKGANELDVRLYPCLSVKNNLGLALEGKALVECLRAKDGKEARAAAIRWLAIRKDRRAKLPKEVIDYEDGNEYMEGLAMYIEWRLPEVLKGRRPPEALRWAQGFHGFEALDSLQESKLSMLHKNMRGEVNVNNDPYGTSPIRSRLYYSGMAIAALLDKFSTDWKSRIFKSETTLTKLAEEALKANAEELRTGLDAARKDPEWTSLNDAKVKLETDGRKDTEKMVAGILKGPNTLLEVDYSALGQPHVGMSFTPFGVRAVDDDRTIYTLVPIETNFGSSKYQFKQSLPTPTLEDRKGRRFQFQLGEAVSAESLASRMGGIKREDFGKPGALDLELPGVRVKAARAEVTHEGNVIRVKMLPTS